MRQLSFTQAATCENATTPHCECRCGGALHGIGRISADAGRSAYEALPPDDPHALRPAEQLLGLDDPDSMHTLVNVALTFPIAQAEEHR